MIENQNFKKKQDLNVNWTKKIFFVFANANVDSKNRRFDFKFDVDFSTNFFIVDSTKKIIDLSMLFDWVRNKDFVITSKNVKKNKPRWFIDVNKIAVSALFVDTSFVFVDVNFFLSKSNQFSWIFAFLTWTMRVDLFFFL